MQSRSFTAELERDAAIDEAARAILQLRSTQGEVLELKRLLAQCHKGRKSEDVTGEDLALERKHHEQMLWQMAQLSDTLWISLYEPTDDCKERSCAMTRAQLKLLVLTTLREAVPMEQQVMYEEMHELYTEIAQHETQQKRTAKQIQSLLHDNENLKIQLASETRALQTRLEAMEMQIERLKEHNMRLESRVLAAPSSGLLLQNESHQQHKSTMSLLLLENVHVSQFQQDELISKSGLQERNLDEALADKQTIKQLQAQIEMYVRYHRRRRDEAEADQAPVNSTKSIE